MRPVDSSGSSTPQQGTELTRFGPSFFVGAYTADMDGEARGIAVLDSRADGSLALRGVAAAADSPSYLASTGSDLYAVSEAAGQIVRFIRGDGEALEYGATADAGGEAPCQLTLVGESLLVANYGTGSLGVLRTSPFALTQTLEATGSGPHEAQDGPHAHATISIGPTATVLSADLGADRIHQHTMVDGRLERVGSLTLPAGTGPRDFYQHPSGVLWVLAELGLELLVLTVGSDSLRVTATVPIPGREPGDHASAIAVSVDGRFAYVGLRGSDRVAWFAVSADGATLTQAGWVPSGGEGPRHLVVEGNFLHVANQLSSTVATFKLNDSGAPQLVREPEKVPSPTFLLRS